MHINSIHPFIYQASQFDVSGIFNLKVYNCINRHFSHLRRENSSLLTSTGAK